MKKILLSALSLVLVAALAIGGTVAYFTDHKKADNVFTVGNVKISLAEPSWNANAVHQIIPGAHFDKDPTITNTGKNDAYLRVKVTFTNAAELAEAFPSFNDALSAGVIKGYDESKWTYVSNILDSTTNTRTVTLYYNGIFAAGASVVLFTDIDIPTALNSQLDALSALDSAAHPTTMTVTADAIQESGFGSVGAAFSAFDAQ